MHFQDRLYQLRKEKGISQEELANVVGVSRQAVQKWEAGSSQPAMDNLVTLARYFSVTLDYLIQGTEDASDNAPRFPYSRCPICFWHYEYKSKHTLFGLPLVHIHFRQWGICRAKGIIAIGNMATGIFSIGLLATGLFALGPLALGGVALGGLAAGLVSLGGLSIGLIAFGGGAIGAMVAVGGGAMGHIAIGDIAQGTITFPQNQWGAGTAEAIGLAIHQTFPFMPSWLVSLVQFIL